MWAALLQVLEGHSVNTYTLINKEGKEQLVKFHWLPHGGAKFMNDEEVRPSLLTQHLAAGPACFMLTFLLAASSSLGRPQPEGVLPGLP